MLKWARENGCPWDGWTCAHAARGGHLGVLMWARENGAPWDEKICACAVGGEGSGRPSMGAGAWRTLERENPRPRSRMGYVEE